MVIDTSALIAILQDEPERRAFNETLEAAEIRAMSTASPVSVFHTHEESGPFLRDRNLSGERL